MKIIHCADLHLDSRMNSNLDRKRAEIRKNELLDTFVRMVKYASDNDIDAIIIAGDMFDTINVSKTTKNTVLHCIKENPAIDFYYLSGNHDSANFLEGMDKLPDNLKFFGNSWTYYKPEGSNVVIAGVELPKNNQNTLYKMLNLDSYSFNIVVLHGQEIKAAKSSDLETVNLQALMNKGIDYLALGHVHSYRVEKLDSRGIYCYPGCLEGRGFDECGEHGFVVLNIDEKGHQFTEEFVPFAKRHLYQVDVNITECFNSMEIIECIENELNSSYIGEDSLVKIVLTGDIDVLCEIDEAYITEHLKDRFFFVKLVNNTVLKLDVADYEKEMSLKGEFVRNVLGRQDISEEDKKEIIRLGLRALDGEKL